MANSFSLLHITDYVAGNCCYLATKNTSHDNCLAPDVRRLLRAWQKKLCFCNKQNNLKTSVSHYSCCIAVNSQNQSNQQLTGVFCGSLGDRFIDDDHISVALVCLCLLCTGSNFGFWEWEPPVKVRVTFQYASRLRIWSQTVRSISRNRFTAGFRPGSRQVCGLLS